jgi:hypothetical protein
MVKNASISVLVNPKAIRSLIANAGLAIHARHAKTDSEQQTFAHETKPVGEPEGVNLLVGNEA